MHRLPSSASACLVSARTCCPQLPLSLPWRVVDPGKSMDSLLAWQLPQLLGTDSCQQQHPESLPGGRSVITCSADLSPLWQR